MRVKCTILAMPAYIIDIIHDILMTDYILKSVVLLHVPIVRPTDFVYTKHHTWTGFNKV